MKKAILTGFEPFGPYRYNPVMDSTNDYNGKIIGNVQIFGLVLPCTYYGAFQILSEKINEISPDIVIGSGLASRISRIRLESIGRNIMNGKYPDAEGRKTNNEKIVGNGLPFYKTNLDNIALANSLFENEISAEVSVDAEGFICNSLIYLTAKRISEENLPIRFAFFHTPWTEKYLDRIVIEQNKTVIKDRDLRKTIEVLITQSAKSNLN